MKMLRELGFRRLNHKASIASEWRVDSSRNVLLRQPVDVCHVHELIMRIPIHNQTCHPSCILISIEKSDLLQLSKQILRFVCRTVRFVLNENLVIYPSRNSWNILLSDCVLGLYKAGAITVNFF